MSSNTPTFVALLIAIGSGMAITIQTAIVNFTGTTIGPIRTGFYIHLAGALAGAILVAFTFARGNTVDNQTEIDSGRFILYFLIGGSMGMIVVPGIAIAFPRIGLIAGQVAIIIGQTIVALVIDTFGLAGNEPLPLDSRRILGLVVMAIAAYLLLPKTDS